MKQINFEYTSNNLPNTDVEELIDLYYELNNNIPITNPNQENTMVRCRSIKFKMHALQKSAWQNGQAVSEHTLTA